MKTTKLQVSFDADKLNALHFYMTKKDINVEDELQAHLDRLYEKTVPVQVREYVESRIENVAPKQEIKAEDSDIKQENKVDVNLSKQEVKSSDEKEDKTSEKQPKQSKRQREKEQAAAGQLEQQPEQPIEQTAVQEQTEEENQGMSMSM